MHLAIWNFATSSVADAAPAALPYPFRTRGSSSIQGFLSLHYYGLSPVFMVPYAELSFKERFVSVDEDGGGGDGHGGGVRRADV